MTPPAIAIIGGGYTGAAVAIHLSRASPRKLDIAILEPRQELGRGVAYSSTDPDHRINGPTAAHFLYPEKPTHFTDWFTADGGPVGDPDALDDLGRAFPRRSEMGRYIGGELAAHANGNPSNSAIRHIRDRAIDITATDDGYVVHLVSGATLAADMAIITTSNAAPSVPSVLEPVASHPGFFPDPWDLERMAEIPNGAEALIIGTGLTMADAALTVVRSRPLTTITAISRRGRLPQTYRRTPPTETLWEALNWTAPRFVARHGRPVTVNNILAVLRRDISALMAAGDEWQIAIDDLRDAAHQLRPALPAAEQSRFIRHLWPWYETHRFRFPPQIEKKVDQLREIGRLNIQAARLGSSWPEDGRINVSLTPRGTNQKELLSFDAVINCTGPQRRPRETGDPFLKNLVAAGYLTDNHLGLGVEVDAACRAIGAGGAAIPRIRVFGPLTRGRFGEMNGVPHTAAQIVTVMPQLVADLEEIFG